MYECCDYDLPTVYNSVIRTARQDHKCCECRETIARGSEYEYVTALYDGRWSSFKTCMLCVRIRKDLFRCGFYHEGLDEMLWDCYGISLDGRTQDGFVD